MSTHASTKINQKEYLKKYLSGDTKKKKKKDKKHKIKESSIKVKIIDDDAHTAKELGIDEELLLTGEDAPQIVGTYIEDKPNGGSVAKWKSINIKDEPEDVESPRRSNKEDDLWGKKSNFSRIKDEFSPERRKEKRKFSEDNSPPRRSMKNFGKEKASLRGKHSPQRKSKRDSSGDISPPRRTHLTPPRNRAYSSKEKSTTHTKTSYTTSGRHRSNSFDQSPPRRRRQNSSDQSPLRRNRKNSNNQSPPRQRRQNPFNKSPTHSRRKMPDDMSPPRRRRNSSSDQSPARRRRKLSAEPSPHRRNKTSSVNQSTMRHKNSDPPPTRKRADVRSPLIIKLEKHSADLSPLRRRNSDQSPPRRRVKPEQSPPRRHKNSDQSPARGRIRSRSPAKIKREKISPDASLGNRKNTERNRYTRWQKSPTRSPSPPPTHKPKMSKTLDGKRAGLQDAHALQSENAQRRQQEDQFYAKMSNEMSGRDAEVQTRRTGGGRLGRRAREARELDPEEQSRKEKHEKHKKEIYDRWGKGLKQIEAHQAKRAEEQYEGSKPLARYSNDEDLDRHLREQERADDPMLEYMRRKKKERQKHAKEPTMPVYEGSFPENRFGIRPGYRWDGVDRSNGYEKKWFDVQNEKRAVQDEAYKYSVEDM